MRTPCVIAVMNRSLLSQGLTNLIDDSGDDMSPVYSAATSMDDFVEDIHRHKADVVVLENSGHFADHNSITKLLMVFSKLLVIIIREDNNWLNIFNREDKLLLSPRDLLDVIYSRSN
jgi:hypothetical protein